MCGLNLNTGMIFARPLTVHLLNIYKNVKGGSQKLDNKPTPIKKRSIFIPMPHTSWAILH